MNRQDFYDGKMFDAYQYMGAHRKGDVIEFVTYAPRAEKIAVIGEFNDWTEEFMEKDGQSGFFSMKSSAAKEGDMYKYCIYGPGGRMQEHVILTDLKWNCGREPALSFVILSSTSFMIKSGW